MKKLELNQMEGLEGGANSPFTDAGECTKLADGLAGTATIFAVASWWTGAGAGVATAIGVGAYFYSLYCKSL